MADTPASGPWPLGGAISFEQLEQQAGSDIPALRAARLSDQFLMIANNLAFNPDIPSTEKRGLLHQLVAQYELRLGQAETQPDALDHGPGDDHLLFPVASKARKRRKPRKGLHAMMGKPLTHPHTYTRRHTKAPIKRERGMDFPARDYAFVPDPVRPATWQVRVAETPGKVTAAQLARAAAQLSASGFAGRRAPIPDRVRAVVARRIRAEYRKLGMAENQIPNSVKGRPPLAGSGERPASNFMLWKDSEGRYRWLAIYSNNYKDRDEPPEIISEQSHKAFVALVDAGLVDYPELWHWHVPGTAWGKADMLDYVDGFALAAGYVYPGHEKEAESLLGREDLGVSHGMPYSTILRDPDDPGVIRFHITREISELPHWAAANPLTDFVVLREANTMPITPQKRQFLKDRGLADDYIDQIESNIQKARASAEETGLISKEADEQYGEENDAEFEADFGEEGEGEYDAESTEEEGAYDEEEDGDAAYEDEGDAEEEEADEKARGKGYLWTGGRPQSGSSGGRRRKPSSFAGRPQSGSSGGRSKKPSSFAGMRRRKEAPEAAPQYVTVEELFEVVTPVLNALAQMSQLVSEMGDVVKELALEDAERLASVKEATPRRSLESLMERVSAIGQDAARIDGRTQLGKEGPEQTKVPTPAYTPVPFINGQIQATQQSQ